MKKIEKWTPFTQQESQRLVRTLIPEACFNGGGFMMTAVSNEYWKEGALENWFRKPTHTDDEPGANQAWVLARLEEKASSLNHPTGNVFHKLTIAYWKRDGETEDDELAELTEPEIQRAFRAARKLAKVLSAY